MPLFVLTVAGLDTTPHRELDQDPSCFAWEALASAAFVQRRQADDVVGEACVELPFAAAQKHGTRNNR